jgi:hypothetical protein
MFGFAKVRDKMAQYRENKEKVMLATMQHDNVELQKRAERAKQINIAAKERAKHEKEISKAQTYIDANKKSRFSGLLGGMRANVLKTTPNKKTINRQEDNAYNPWKEVENPNKSNPWQEVQKPNKNNPWQNL